MFTAVEFQTSLPLLCRQVVGHPTLVISPLSSQDQLQDLYRITTLVVSISSRQSASTGVSSYHYYHHHRLSCWSVPVTRIRTVPSF